MTEKEKKPKEPAPETEKLPEPSWPGPKVKIIIPSAQRWKTMSTHTVITDFQVYVPEPEAKEYEAVVGADRVKVHPPGLGKGAKLNHYFENEDYEAVVFMDDDILAMHRVYLGRTSMQETAIKDPAMVHEIINKTAYMAKEIGAYFFGWSTNAKNAMYYDGFRPFRLKGFINGIAQGFIKGHKLRYDLRMIGKVDYDISLQNALHHRYCFIEERFSFAYQPSFVNASAALRTVEKEKEVLDRLKKKWGDHIYSLTPLQSKNPRMNRKSRGQLETLALRIPW